MAGVTANANVPTHLVVARAGSARLAGRMMDQLAAKVRISLFSQTELACFAAYEITWIHYEWYQ